MMRGECIRCKVYASCFGILKNLATCHYWFRGFKDKNTLCGSFEGRKQERSYREGI